MEIQASQIMFGNVFLLTCIVNRNLGYVLGFTSFLLPADCFMDLEDEISNSC